MANEHTKLQSDDVKFQLGDTSASELIPVTTDSIQSEHNGVDSKSEGIEPKPTEVLFVEPSSTDPKSATRTEEDIRRCIVHAPDAVQPISELISEAKADDGRRYACLNKATGMSERLGIYYQIIPPGYRTACPHAHSKEDELVFCLQGRGTIWQNGWIYPFEPGDVVGWKAGTGVTHCIINDTKPIPGQLNQEEESLILLVVGENKPGEDELYYPHNPERYEYHGILRWENVTPQNEGGAHPGVARAERPNDPLPGHQLGARPSNIVNWRDQLAPAGEGELFAYATSLSQETGLSGRFGCNLEIIPPGARSSDPHAHSLEDELVFIIHGEGLVWLDGHTFPVSSGDAIGFRGGTGLAHTIINNSNADDKESGQDLVIWIVGENRRVEDRVVYPIHPEKSTTFPRWWKDAPTRKLVPYMMSTPSGTEPTPASDPGAHLAGAKALLAKKLAQKENPAMVSSPTDNMMTPATAKINAVKKKHFMKGRPISGPKFGTALATSSTPQKLEDGEEIADSESDIHKTTEP